MDSLRVAAERPARSIRACRKPDGGYRFISSFELLWAFWAYQAGFLRWRDFRVWLACHEAVARRIGLANGQEANYRVEEIRALVGGGAKQVCASLSRLGSLGFLRFEEHAITFAKSPDELRIEDLTGFWEAVGRLGQKNRKAPVPRRTVRFIAGGVRKTVAATMLGQVLRCCYLNRGAYSAEGSCSASWVASVFQVDERHVKTARKHLVSIGWLLPVESDFWHRQRHGGRGVVNPNWSRPVAVGEGGSKTELPPRRVRNGTQTATPLILNRELLTESKNQKPASGTRPGVSKETTSQKKPTMEHVEPEDLRDTTRTLELLEDAARRGLVTASQADRLKFVAAAERAISVGTKNPPGLFSRIVRAKLWHHLTQDDEDAAARRLKRHFFGNPRSQEKVPKPLVQARSALSIDARIVVAVVRVAREQRVACEPFYLLQRERPDWTRERWEAAERELETCRLAQFRRAV